MHPVTDSQYSSIIFAALNLEGSLPWYWYSILNLGGLLFLHSRLNWTAWRRAWSGSSNNAESHRSAHRSFHVVPCRSIIFPAQWQRMAIRLGPSFPQRPRRGSPIQTCGSWTLHCTLGLAKDAYDWADWEACDWEGRHHDSAHSTHGNQCGFVAWTLHGF